MFIEGDYSISYDLSRKEIWKMEPLSERGWKRISACHC